MRKRSTLAAALFITTLWHFVPVSRAQYCGLPPKELTEGDHREYRGLYENRAYDYSVVIPANLAGYDDVNPFYQHGFGMVVGSDRLGYIFVNGEPNGLEFVRPSDAASQVLEYLRKRGNKVETSQVREIRADQLAAVLLTATYRCPGSTELYVRSSMVAISPDKSKLYEVTLYALASSFERDEPTFDAVVR